VPRSPASDGSAQGTAYLAGLTIGLWTSEAGIAALARPQRRYEPAMDDARVDVDPIQQRAGDPLLVTPDDHRAAQAGVFWVAPVTTRTRILRADQHVNNRFNEL
jgi:hypothetical protein